MSLVIRRLTGLSTATTNDLAHIDFPVNGYITAMFVSILPASYASGDTVDVEISTSSTSQTTTNDAIGIIAHADFGGTVVTSGAIAPTNAFIGPCKIPVRAGTRLYLHTAQVGTSSTRVRADIHFVPFSTRAYPAS